ncbi:pectinesterase family protein [Aestuariibaculum suncheonense]|uniref:T9SS type A sorting domain-containing protein n=1 Tax=Aestuariibaculum suncheonense TaxID=1028745 RepID=A0A8J6Q4E4_9FLAO|nr:pectinesterase family protein [Aestuariibaculum suncheonense]MBD0834184.1 T9SS type A sorting domain-containing protein [Aestuariibaculum suncheonense]
MKQKLSFIFVISLLCAAFVAHGQITNAVTYDFTDGTIITNQASADGKLTLGGTYIYHGTSYGLNLKLGNEININVDGSCTIRFLGSQYSGLNMVGTATTTGDLGEQITKVVNDKVDTYDFVYSGTATTLNFKTVSGTGNDTYLPSIEVIPVQLGKDFSAAEKNIAYKFDLRDQSIVPASPSNHIEAGLFVIDAGCCNGLGLNGSQHGITFKDGNSITLQIAGNSYIRVAADQYSGGNIDVSSTSGAFDIASQSNNTGATYSDGNPLFVDFLYAGDAGTVVLEHTGGGTTYIPYIEISPIPFEVNLTPWVQKSGTVTINGTEITFTSGADASSNASITVNEGTVISATNEAGSILIDLGGQALSTYTPIVTGDIASATISGNVLTITFSDTTSNPNSFPITIADNSSTVTAEPGTLYTYNFADGSEIPQTSYSSLRYSTFITSDGIVTINSNTTTDSVKFGFHDATHGLVAFPGNSFDMVVAGNATISFIVDIYGSATDAVFEFTDANSNVLGTIAAQNIGISDAFASSFSYTGPAGVITATLKSANFPTAEVYLHGLTIENAAAITPSNGLPDVWDFGAVQLDDTQYNNKLTEDDINAWYGASISPGTAGVTLPSFTAGVLSWVGGSSDRLRTSNTNLSRYDENLSGVTEYTGRIYVNATGATGRYLSIALSEDDELTIWGLSQNGSGKLHFEYVPDPSAQNDIVDLPGTLTEIKFVAKSAGTYHLYDATDKPSYYHIVRKDATYLSLTGTVDTSMATDIPSGYSIQFTNEAGKTWETTVNSGNYQIDLPIGYTYNMNLTNANGYIISNGTSLSIDESTTTYNIAIQKVDLYNVSGSITGLDSNIANLSLMFTPDPNSNTVFTPQVTLDSNTGTYTVQLEANLEYTISAEGVNDYFIPSNTVTIPASDTTQNITFETKATYAVNIDTPGLNAEQKAKLSITFTNLNEAGYSYTFNDVTTVVLRNGVYAITTSGLDEYPIELALTSNLEINDAIQTKTLTFNTVTNWPFNDADITSSTLFYKGISFTGTAGAIKNERAKGHLACATGGEINIPLQPGEKMIVTYYYAANFSIDGGTAITTNSGSTSQFESVEYKYAGTSVGTATITINASTYITNIQVVPVVDYKPELRVGVDKDYQTINGALNAISRMDRPNNERVTVLIDAGNYEEMVVIDNPNITLKNTSPEPSIALKNKGVDIDDHAVRITSYYGYGYNYFSQGTDNKWNPEALAVNKANGYQLYTNVSGTTNASYWNATLVVKSTGFIAEDIIIENSFNQYISKKESEDIVELGNGNKGTRPTDYGNTSVQDRSFVERAAAIGIANGADQVILNKCRIVGRQDSFYGGSNARVVAYKGAYMGAVDYIFGGMTAVFYQSDFVLNTSDVSSDAAYITAAQQGSGRGFLMYECNVISTIPGVNTASSQGAKPGYFGRPWQATTSEVVFYKTNIDVSTFNGYEGKSLIDAEGWRNTLGGESALMYEFGSIEKSGENNSANRASWSTVLSTPTLTDGTEITTFNFTKGNDDWDPIPTLIENEDTDNDGISDATDNCIDTYNPDQADMDNDGIGDVCDDSDGDGLMDNEDSCPNSTVGATIDVFGCEVFELPADNYSIVTTASTCNGGNNGSISVSADNNDYTYNVNISGSSTNYTLTLSSTNEFSDRVSELASGTYTICITIEGKDDYEQCFNVTLNGPEPLTTYSVVNHDNNTITLTMSGASVYHVEHNGKTTTTSKSEIVIDLTGGSNTIVVTTDEVCQGKFFEQIFVSESISAYPNPTKGFVQIYVGGTDDSINVGLFDVTGRNLMSKSENVPSNRVIELNISMMKSGSYVLSLDGKTVRKSVKIIKE